MTTGGSTEAGFVWSLEGLLLPLHQSCLGFGVAALKLWADSAVALYVLMKQRGDPSVLNML